MRLFYSVSCVICTFLPLVSYAGKSPKAGSSAPTSGESLLGSSSLPDDNPSSLPSTRPPAFVPTAALSPNAILTSSPSFSGPWMLGFGEGGASALGDPWGVLTAGARDVATNRVAASAPVSSAPGIPPTMMTYTGGADSLPVGSISFGDNSFAWSDQADDDEEEAASDSEGDFNWAEAWPEEGTYSAGRGALPSRVPVRRAFAPPFPSKPAPDAAAAALRQYSETGEDEDVSELCAAVTEALMAQERRARELAGIRTDDGSACPVFPSSSFLSPPKRKGEGSTAVEDTPNSAENPQKLVGGAVSTTFSSPLDGRFCGLSLKDSDMDDVDGLVLSSEWGVGASAAAPSKDKTE